MRTNDVIALFSSNIGRTIGVAILVALALMPLYASPYWLHTMTILFINVMLGVSLRLTLMTGQFNVGHPAFMAIGAYSAVMVAKFLGVPTSVSFLIGGLVPAVVSLVIGRIVLRLQGVYFALTTIALVEVIRIAYSRGGNLTGGLAGMSGIPPLSIFGKSITSNEEFYVFGFILVLIVIFILHRIEVSRVGYTWKALSQSDNLASASGISTMGYKTAAFAVGCFFAGVAGAFMAYFSRYLVPTMFDFNMAVHILIYNYVGGLTTIAGPILGAGFFTFLSEPFKGFAQYETLFFGSALIIVIVLLPGGIITLPERIKTVITSHRFSRNSGVATER